MRKLLPLLVLGLFAIQDGHAQTTLMLEDFEDTDLVYSQSPAECGDQTDFVKRTDGSDISTGYVVTGIQGSFFFAAMDTNGAPCTDNTYVLTFSGIDITNMTSLVFSGFFAEDDDGSNQDWDATSSVRVTAQIDGGAMVNVLAFEAKGSTNTEPAQDTNFDGVGDGTTLTSALAQFSGNIAGTGSSLTVTITIDDLNDGDEDIAFDNIQVQGTTATSDTRVAFASASASQAEGDSGTQDVTVDLVITNPSTNNATFVTIGQSGTADGTDASLGTTAYSFGIGSSLNQTVTITVNGDTDIESDETVVLTITNVSGGDNAAAGSPDTYTLTITNDDVPPLVINEILYDPATDDSETLEVEGDANGDGERDAEDDEFVEIYNTSTTETVDISGYTISDAEQVRFTFPTSTTLGPQEGIVVFGGGTPTNIPVSTFTVSGTSTLNLSNGGDTVTLATSGGVEVDVVGYSSSSASDQSYALNPDFTGSYVGHLSITSNPVPFSPGRDNTDNSALPVELTSFEAIASTDAVNLAWTTASETNNAGFEIQQAIQDGSFSATTFITGQGTTLQAQSYQHTVANLIPGQYRFRLKQVDYDGAFEYSPEVEVTVGVEHSFQLSEAYPNPFNPETVFSVSVQNDQRVEVAVYNLLGQRVRQLYTGTVTAGAAQRVVFDASGLPGGVYLIQARGAEAMQSRTITLLK
ncbi:MAG: lamin tail domain-containing protein [Bacteroidota bacterium]